MPRRPLRFKVIKVKSYEERDMEDADSDSGFDSDGDWHHAGRDIVYGLRTDSNAVGPTEHTEDGSCV